ncbi:ABC transporter substrate-binding protein [Acetobacter persici]|uniref:ABC transporter substrate-binding protein n=1 Tax=Acetobacter persici TaxID=1076596 RepID=UPI001BAA6F61|nr:ABC transporter substrate-binding protein [Acetobacter persici]MBS1017275.1 hypothetical protein [Acetobacter persici]
MRFDKDEAETKMVLSRRSFLAGSAGLSAVSVMPADATEADMELVIGLASMPMALDPHFYVLAANSSMAANVFDCLVVQDAQQNICPCLAIHWKMRSSNEWIFTLRPDARFSNGQPVTAADVVASISRVRRVAVGSLSSFVPYVEAITSVEADGPDTVKIRTASAAPLLLRNLSRIAIVSAEQADLSTDAFNRCPAILSSGPYAYAGWTAGESVRLCVNPYYWGRTPDWHRVRFVGLPDDRARSSALLSGDVDVIDGLPTENAAAFKQYPDINVASAPGSRILYLDPDVSREVSPFASDSAGRNPLTIAAVREALSLSIDRASLVTHIMDGQGVAAGQLVLPGYPGYVSSLGSDPYDPSRARSILSEHGLDTGFNLTLHASNDRYPNDSMLAQAIGEMFSHVGVNIQVVTMPASVLFSRASRREFSLIMGAANCETGEASSVIGPLLHSYGASGGQGNRGRYSNSALDRALSDAASESDEQLRQLRLEEAMKIGMTDRGVIPVVFFNTIWASRLGVRVVPRMDGYTLAQNVERS